MEKRVSLVILLSTLCLVAVGSAAKSVGKSILLADSTLNLLLFFLAKQPQEIYAEAKEASKADLAAAAAKCDGGNLTKKDKASVHDTLWVSTKKSTFFVIPGARPSAYTISHGPF